MKREMIKPGIIILILVSVFATVFVAMNSIAFAAAREEVVQVNGTYEDARVVELEIEDGDTTGEYEMFAADLYAELEWLTGDLNTENTYAEVIVPITGEFYRHVEIYSECGTYVRYIRMYFDCGAYLTRNTSMEYGMSYAQGFVLPRGYSCIDDFTTNLPVHEINVNPETLRRLLGNEVRFTRFPVEMTFTMEDSTRWMKVSQSHNHVDDFTLQPHHLSFEQVAMMVAVAIYEEFGESVDGLDGYMHFMGHGSSFYFSEGVWSGFIRDGSRTGHNMSDELFHFMINAVTGEITHIDMTTVDNPWHG